MVGLCVYGWYVLYVVYVLVVLLVLLWGLVEVLLVECILLGVDGLVLFGLVCD